MGNISGLYVEQIDMDKYALVLNHTLMSPRRFQTFLEGRYKNNTYSMLSNVDLNREASVQLHFDKWRDVHITAIGINEENNKECGIEIKWDASRDPTMKFLADVHLNKFVSLEEGKNISAIMRISYPGRTVVGSYLYAFRLRNNYLLDTSLEWSADKIIRLTFGTDFDNQNWVKVLKLESQLLTPFENWKKTSLNGK